MTRAERIDQALKAAGIPIAGVGASGGADRIDFAPEATAAQQTQAQTILAGLDLSAAGLAAGEYQRVLSAALALQSAVREDARLLRAAALVTMDEVNLLREWVTSFKAATAAATTLADLKTRVAALANLPDRMPAQIKTALTNRVNSVDAD